MVAFTVGGMFLNKAHFDLFYHMVAIILVFGRMAFAEMEDPVKYPLRDGNRGQISFSQARLFGGKQISKSREFRDPQPAFGGRRTTQTLTTGTLKKRQS